MGFEPTTCGLENRCSTIELHPQLTLLEVSPHWLDFFASPAWPSPGSVRSHRVIGDLARLC